MSNTSIPVDPIKLRELRIAALEAQIAEVEATRAVTLLKHRQQAVQDALRAAGLDPDGDYAFDLTTNTALSTKDTRDA